MPPPVELRNRPQDGISWIQKVAAVELGFWLLVLIVWGYVDIYGRKKYIGGALRGPRGRGRALPYQAHPPPSWAPCCSTDVLLPPIYTHVPPNDQKRSKNPNSTAVTFCIPEIPSWGLFRSSTGGGIDHGGLLHQHHGLSDEV